MKHVVNIPAAPPVDAVFNVSITLDIKETGLNFKNKVRAYNGYQAAWKFKDFVHKQLGGAVPKTDLILSSVTDEAGNIVV